MADPNATRRLEPWQAAQIRQQIYADILALSADLGPLGDDTAERLLGQDLHEFVLETFANTVAVLNKIGWAVDHDVEVMRAHDKSLNEEDRG